MNKKQNEKKTARPKPKPRPADTFGERIQPRQDPSQPLYSPRDDREAPLYREHDEFGEWLMRDSRYNG